MDPLRATAPAIRFGPFAFDFLACELRKHGVKLKLAGQPLEVLTLLLRRPGELVTREELQRMLWPHDTVVDFEFGVNTAIYKLRLALGDDSETPRYIETLPRRGYRLIAPVEVIAAPIRGVPAAEPAVPAAPSIEPPSAEAELEGESTKPTTRLVGRTISHFRVLEQIGSGAMGVIYKAEDTRLGRMVALKFLPPHMTQDPMALRRFEREARAASALNHPNICTVYDIGEYEGQPFITMELLEGETLKERLAHVAAVSDCSAPMGTSALQLGELLDLGVQVADVLDSAHSKGIIHRDIKPANIFLTTRGQPKVLDFGVAKLTRPLSSAIEEKTEWEGVSGPARAAGVAVRDGTLTQAGSPIGTAAYMSPEQVRGEVLDARTDIFSFGAVLYEAATGRKAFPGETAAEVQQAILTHQPDWAKTLNPDLPAKLDEIIHRALEKDRELRYQNAADLRGELQRLKREVDASRAAAAIPASTPAAVMKTSLLKRRPVITAAATAVITLMLSLAGWLVWQRSHPAAPEPRSSPVPLTSYPGFALQPTFSPDSNEVAFCWNEARPDLPPPPCCQDHYDIYRKQIGGGEPLRLTRNAAGGESPAWSPDGRSIAFYQYPRQFYIMPSLGGSEREMGKANYGVALWRQNYPISTLAWSMDGKWLLLPDRPCTENCAAPQGVFAFSVDTGVRRRLTFCPESMWADSYPAMSPDGRTLAFVRLQELGLGDVYLLSLDENVQPQGEPQRLTYENLWVQSPVWTRDGKEIFFSTGAILGERSIRSVSATPPTNPGGYHPRLEAFGEDATTLAISPNGRRLAYARVSQTINICKVALSGAPGSARKPQIIAASSRLDREPDFSPDGNKIAFTSTRSGSMEIWVCDADGSNARQITSMGGPFTGYPRWSPDGNTILFGARPEAVASLYVVSATGGTPRRLSKIPAFWGSWSHDGKWIYFTSYGQSRDFLYRMPASGGDAVQLGKGWIDAAESVDGKWVYSFDNGGLWKLPAAGGQPILVSKGAFHGDFAVVEDGVYYTTGDWTGKAAVLFYDFATAKTKVVAQMENPAFKGIAISPDRRWALLTQIQHTGSDLMLVENFR